MIEYTTLQYHNLLNQILLFGDKKPNARENIPGTISLFGPQMKIELKSGFPILTTKKVSFKNIVVELLWFLKGDTNVKYLKDNNCNIWDQDSYSYYCKIFKKNYPSSPQGMFTYEEWISLFEDYNLYGYELQGMNYNLGDCGKQYGWLWREWAGDQFKSLIEGLQKSPDSRRHIITAWNPETLNDMALNTCHSFVQFNCVKIKHEEREKIMAGRGWGYPPSLNKMSEEEIEEKYFSYYNIPKYYLDCKMYQRSADTFLGVPYNTSSYALLMNIIGSMVNMIPRNFIHSFGDCHIYDNHLDAVNEQLSRDPNKYKLPTLKFSPDFNNAVESFRNNFITLDDFINELEPSMFSLENYQSYPAIKAELSTGIIK